MADAVRYSSSEARKELFLANSAELVAEFVAKRQLLPQHRRCAQDSGDVRWRERRVVGVALQKNWAFSPQGDLLWAIARQLPFHSHHSK